MSKVRIPPTLRVATGGNREVEADGATVREIIDDLVSRFPALRGQLIAEDDELAPFVNVYVGQEDVRTLDGLDTPVAAGSTVILLPAMAGGSLTSLAARGTPCSRLDRLSPKPASAEA